MKFVITVLVLISLLFSASLAPAVNSLCPIFELFPPLIGAGDRIYTTREFEIVEVGFRHRGGNISVRKISALSFEVPRGFVPIWVHIREKKSGEETLVYLNLKPR